MYSVREGILLLASCLNSAPLLLLASALVLAGPVHAATGQETDEQLAAHQERAREAEARQDFPTAIREYRTLVQAIPKNAELESNLGVALYFNHDLAEAARVLARAETLNPALYSPHLFFGLDMAQSGKPDAAVPELEKAVAINDRDPLAHAWLGYEYTAQSRFDKAVRELNTAAQKAPNDQDVWFGLGRCYLELGKKETLELLRAAPDGGRTWQLAGEQYDAQGKSGEALRLYQGALDRRPDLADLRTRVVALGGAPPVEAAGGDRSYAQEDRLYALVHSYQAKAKDAFEHVAQIDPASYRAHQILGDSYAAADRFDQAIAEYRKVIEIKPDLPGIHGDLCNALSRTGRMQEAIKECDAEIATSPYSAEAYVQDARLHVLEDDNLKADTLLKKALALDRPPIAVFKLVARVDVAKKQYGEAITALRRYLAVESNDASAWFLLARADKAAGNIAEMKEAIETYKKTSAAAKGSGEALVALDSRREQDASQSDADSKDAGPR